MTWLIWNIRGLNKRYKQKEGKQYINEKQIVLASLVERKLKEAKTGMVISRIAPGWNMIAIRNPTSQIKYPFKFFNDWENHASFQSGSYRLEKVQSIRQNKEHLVQTQRS